MTIPEFIAQQPAERQAVFSALHNAIIANDASVTPVIGTMMRVEMILYNEDKCFKYGLAGTAKYMSLHCMPIYMNPPLHTKYSALLPKAKFQKGCINFTDLETMPADVVAGLIKDCSAISIAALLADRFKKKK